MKPWIERACSAMMACGLLLCLSGCQQGATPKSDSAGTPDDKSSSLVIVTLHPDGTPAGKDFNLQPDGNSALAITCRGATNKTTIVFAGERLPTVFGDTKLVTAEVPKRLYSTPGNYDVRLENERERSNTVQFDVR